MFIVFVDFSVSASSESLAPPSITYQPYSREVAENNSTIFYVGSSDADTYQWQVQSGGSWSNLSNVSPYSGVDTKLLALSSVNGLNDKQYRCIVSNGGGSLTSDPVRLIAVSSDLRINVGDAGNNCFIAADKNMWHTGNDGLGTLRNIFTGTSANGNNPYQVKWSTGNSRWELRLDANHDGVYEVLTHYNSNASAPNPPNLGTGTWVVNEVACGSLGTFQVLIPTPGSLSAGDIAFVGFNSDDPDGFSFVALKDIPANEVINFTDHGWAKGSSNTWMRGSEAHFSWTAPAGGLAAGSIVSIIETSDDVLTVTGGGTVGSIVEVDGKTAESFSLLSDNLFAYQGILGSLNPTFLTGLLADDNYLHTSGCDNLTTKWFTEDIDATNCPQMTVSPPSSGGTSTIAPGLTNGTNAVMLNPFVTSSPSVTVAEVDNYKYNGTFSGTPEELAIAINDYNNWLRDNDNTYDINPSDYNGGSGFSVTVSEPPAIPTATSAPGTICDGNSALVTISGDKNDATAWHVYTGSCGGTLVGTTAGSTIIVTPTPPSTTYYIRGEGGGVTPGACGSITVNTTARGDASFTYGENSFCNSGSDPSPIVTGVSNGTFSSSAGLQLNPFSGVIDLSESTLGVYTVTYTTSGLCAGEEDFIVTITGCPEINIKARNTDIADGDTSPNQKEDTDFAYAYTDGEIVTHTFTIENLGASELTLSGLPVVSGTHSSDFTITDNPSLTIAEGESTSFDVTFNPSTTGTRNATITVNSDDADEAVYNFDIRGIGQNTTQVRWVNNQSETRPSTIDLEGVTYDVFANTYTTIQSAINAATNDDIVLITDGVYRNAAESTSTNCAINGADQDQALYLNITNKRIKVSSETGDYCSSSARLVGYGFDIRYGFSNPVTIQGLHIDSVRVNAFWNTNNVNYGAFAASNVKILRNKVSNTRSHGLKTDSGGGFKADRGAWDIVGNVFENIGFYDGSGFCTTPAAVSAMWLGEAGDSFVISDNIIDNTKWAGILCDGYTNLKINGNRVSNTGNAGIQIGFSSANFYSPDNADISHNTITNANISQEVGIGAITILHSNVTGVNITYNDISSSFNGLAIEIAGWQDSPDITYVNKNNFHNLTSGSFGVTHIAGIAPNGLFGTADDLTNYNFENNYWGDASGPTYTTNPSGTGEGLWKETTVKGSGGNALVYSTGDFDFTPFATAANTVNSIAVQSCTAPEINLKGNGVSIVNGDNSPSVTDSTDFGSHGVASGSNTNTFTIENTGSATLSLTGSPRVSISGHTTDFTVSLQPSSTTISASGNLTFQVKFDPTATGLREATISIANDDADENPYTFDIQGTGISTCATVANGTELMTWTGAKNTTWNDACNWSPAGIPTAGNDVEIPSAPSNQPTINTMNEVASSVTLESGATLTISSIGRLTLNGANSLNSTLLNEGTVENNGKLVLGNLSPLSSEGITNTGTFNNNSGAEIEIDRTTLTAIYNFGGTFNNAAEITIGANATVGDYGITSSNVFNNNTGGEIKIDNANLDGIRNFGTFTNVALLTIGANVSAGTDGIDNRGTFNNNTGGIINIDNSGTNAIHNGTSSIFTNVATMTIGANSSVGVYGIFNLSTFNNNTGGNISIDNSTSTGIYNLIGTFSNVATLTLGTNASLGVYGIYNSATFNNNGGGNINIDNSTTAGLYNFSGTFSNAATLTLGANASVGDYGLQNDNVFNNNTGGEIKIDNSTLAGIRNNGTFTNAAILTIGANVSAGSEGIENRATFNNNTGGIVSIDNCRNQAIINTASSIFNNVATITIGANSSVGGFGIFNQSTFNNNTGGNISIDNSTSIGLLNLAGTFTNSATLTLGANASVGNYGMDNRATFNNNTGGILSIDNCTTTGLYTTVTGAFINSATLRIGANSSVGNIGLNINATFNNNNCGEVLVKQGRLQVTPGITYTNEGYTFVANELSNLGTFTNNGVLKYGTTTGNAISNATAPSIIVNDDPTPIFTYGAAFNGTIDGIFKDDSVTSAGTFSAPNTFTPSGLASGSQTLIAKITPNGGGCTYLVPFDYVNCMASATISYTGTPFCTSASPASVTLTGTTGGAFTSSPAGLTLNSSSGQITPSSSSAGTYTVTYTIAASGGCPSVTATTAITINALDDASFSYGSASYCVSAADPTPTITGVSGGSFSSTAGLIINASTGAIDVSASTAGTYTVTYTTGGTCSNSSTASVSITALDDAGFSYGSASYCVDASDPTPTITGAAGGTFSSTVGLSINSGTGAIDVSASTAGTYTVTYTTGGTCSNSSTASVSITALDDAGFNYASASYCADASDPTPTITGAGGGTFSSTVGLSINSGTGAIDVSASTAGTYTVTYTTGGTCSNSSTASVSITALDDASFSYGSASYCLSAADPTPTITGVSGGTFSSTAGLSINAATGAIDASASTAGTYTVTYTTGGTCSNSSTASVSITALDDASFSYGSASYCVSAADPTPTITGVSGGSFSSTAGLIINASTGAIDVSASTAGTYTVTYTTGGTCSNSSTASVSITALDDAGFNYASASYCVNAADPTPTITGVSGGTFSSTSGLIINASTGAIDVSASTPGTYNVTYTTGGTCSNSSTASVSITALDDASFSYGSASYCVDASDPTPTITGVSGGSFSSTGGLSINASSGAIDVSASTPGTYTVTYTTGGTCSNSSTASVSITALDDASFSYGSASYCISSADPTPTITGVSGGTFSSTVGLSISSGTGAIDVSASTPGTYTVTYTTGGTCSNSSTASVSITALDNASFSYGSSSYCADASDPTPTITGVSGGTFSSTAGLSINAATGAIDASASTAGTYTVTYTTGGTCSNSSTASVSITALDDASFSYGSASYCVSAADPTPTITGVSGGSFSSTAGLIINASTGAIDVSASTAGTYTVTYTTGGTCSNSSTASVSITALDDASFSYGSASYCVSAADPTPTITGVSGGSFSSTSGLSINASTGAIDVSASTPGTYTVTYTTGGTCSNSSTASVSITALDDASFSYGSASYCVSAADPTPTITGVSGGSFSSTSGLSINASTGAIDVSASTPGTYTVTYTTGGTCSNSSTASVSITALDDASFSYGSASYCVSAADPTPTITGVSGGSFSSTSGLSINASTGAIDVSASTPGTYTVTYTTGGTCSNSSTASVSITALDDASFSYGSASYCVSAADPTPTITGASGGTFSSTVGLSINSGTGAIDVSASTPGTYTVTYTTGGTCSNSSNTSVTINALPTVSISGIDDLTCGTASVTRTASGGGTYSWSNGDNIATATINAAGTYTVTVTSANGCTATATTVVTQDVTTPSATITGAANLSCAVTSVTRTASGGGTYSWSNGDNTATATINAAGTYTVTVSSANGCTATATTVVTQDVTVPSISITGTDSLSCTQSSVTRTAVGTGTYQWSNGLGTNATATMTSAGTYTVTLTAANGCTNTATTAVVFKNNLVVTASNDGPYQDGENINLMATGGPSYSWAGPNGFTSSSVNPSIANATAAKAGIYTVTVNNGSCTGTATTNVIVSCSTPGMSYYLAYTDGAEPEVFSPLIEQMEVQVSNRPMTVLAVPNCELPVIESTRLQLSGTGNNHFYIDNALPFSLYEVNGVATGEAFEANYYTFIARGFDQGNSEVGTEIIGPDELHFSVVRGDREITSPTLSTNTICAGTSLTVSSTASGVFSFNVGNMYRAYLSDENGNFGNQILIGSSSDPTNISCTIPNNLPSGNNYKVVVRSSSPMVSSAVSASLSITSSSVSLLSPTHDILSGTRTEQATQTVNAQNKISGGANVSYKAGNAVMLEPGFSAASGTVFSAKIENVCAD